MSQMLGVFCPQMYPIVPDLTICKWATIEGMHSISIYQYKQFSIAILVPLFNHAETLLIAVHLISMKIGCHMVR